MTKRVRAISTLKREAGRAARQRGHAIRWFRALTGATWQGGGCRCGAYIHVEQMPAPNGVEISGDAVAVDHETMIGSGGGSK